MKETSGEERVPWKTGNPRAPVCRSQDSIEYRENVQQVERFYSSIMKAIFLRTYIKSADM